MVGKRERDRLRLRKQALILESEINRHLLATEWRKTQSATAWVGEAARWGQRARAWWPLVVPALGALVGRCFRRTAAPPVGRARSLLSWLTWGYSLWKQVQGTDHSNDTATTKADK
jgi:hypothetical protein